MPELRGLRIDDAAAAWVAAGFAVNNSTTSIGAITVTFVDPAPVPVDAISDESGRAGDRPLSTGRGVIGWEMTDLADGSLDGIATWNAGTTPDAGATPDAGPTPNTGATPDAGPTPNTGAVEADRLSHPNGVSRMDHVVVVTPDIERTTTAFEQAGFTVKRTREMPGSQPLRLQRFIWAGETILEVIGPAEATGDGPASIWGLALTTENMEGAVSAVGAHLTPPKQAVQPGRQIATIDSKGLGMRTAVALMTPHVPVGDSRSDQR